MFNFDSFRTALYKKQNSEWFYVKQADYKGKDSQWKRLPKSGVKKMEGEYKNKLIPVILFDDTGKEKKLAESLSRGSL